MQTKPTQTPAQVLNGRVVRAPPSQQPPRLPTLQDARAPSWLRKGAEKAIRKGGLMLIGIEPGTENYMLRFVKQQQGLYEWQMGNGKTALVSIRPSFVRPSDQGFPVMFVDLRHMVPMLYKGARVKVAIAVPHKGRFINEDEPLRGTNAFGEHVEIDGFWQVDNGWERYNESVNEDLQKINRGGSGWLAALGRFMPLLVISSLVLLLAVLGIAIAILVGR